MFDEVLKQLEKLDKTHEVEIPADDDGYLDRLCRKETCGSRFKVFAVDWNGRVGHSLTCPICGRAADPDEYVTNEQLDYIQSVAAHAFQKAMHEGLKKDAAKHNRRERARARDARSVRTKISVTSPAPKPPRMMAAWDAMRINHRCGGCDTRFATVGAWFYCPACGSTDPRAAFRQSLHAIRHTVELLDEALATLGADLAADFHRRTLESGIGGLVAAFQVVVEAMYLSVPNATPPRRNTFQNLGAGSELWVALGGSTYERLLGVDALRRMEIAFQRRHILQHNDGAVDAAYLRSSGDSAYHLGQRIVVRARDVLELCELVERLVAAMDAEVGRLAPAL